MKKHFLVLLSVALLQTTGCTRTHTHSGRDDFSRILSRGEIDVLTVSGSMSYFIYKGEPKGYEYELLNSFAENYELKVNIRPVENETKLMEMLLQKEGDLIACNIPISNEGKKNLLYCGREVINEQVLVQRANRGDTLLKDVTGLIGKEVWVIHDSKHYKRLVNLNNELGGGIHIRTIDKDTISVEDLIEMVSKGKISYTVSDADMASLNKTYFQNTNISMVVGHSQRSSWATGKGSPELAAAIDKWFADNQNKAGYKKITKRYFEMSKLPGDEAVPVIGPGQISPYDSLFRKYAAKIPWDWRLLASVSYQESKFYTNLVSWAGAAGLMGLMPQTAQAFGVSEDMIYDPESNVKAAVGLIRRLNRSFASIEDENERIKFILASYNAGTGHIFDAQALSEKYDKNAYVWSDVEEFLKLKSLQEYYNDPICKLGYFRSGETVNYVQNVFERWVYYKEIIEN
ncbi:MAG: transglycosylase SLT domain-containing protein [Candidatus Symbiothrix sp.]|nr:transglycosylase SLT domain-containing protein [Candidatus Symbiothrix sp.]